MKMTTVQPSNAMSMMVKSLSNQIKGRVLTFPSVLLKNARVMVAANFVYSQSHSRIVWLNRSLKLKQLD